MIKIKGILFIGILVLLSGCANTVGFEEATNIDPVGFWHGLWHGVVAPIAFIGHLFNPDIAVYAIYNTGGWYDFGFLLGVVEFITLVRQGGSK